MKNKLKEFYPNELNVITENTSWKVCDYEGVQEIIYGSKKNHDYRLFYRVKKTSLELFIDYLYTKKVNFFNLILEKIVKNENLLNPSVIKLDNEYKYSNFAENLDQDFSEITSQYHLFSKKIIHLDIYSMYESTYTHSLGWSLEGKEEYKKIFNHRHEDPFKEKWNYFLDFNKIDKKYCEDVKGDEESVSLLTGLPISDVFADFILSGIDAEIRKIKEYKCKDFNFYHFKDNYSFIFYTENSKNISSVIRKINNIFLSFKYKPNFSYNGKKIISSKINEINYEDVIKTLEKEENEKNTLWKENSYFNPYEEEFYFRIDEEKLDAMFSAIEESTEKQLKKIIQENPLLLENKLIFTKYFYTLYNKYSWVKKEINSWLDLIIKKPKSILEKEVFNLIIKSNLINIINEDLQERISKALKDFWDKKYQLECLAWMVIFDMIPGNPFKNNAWFSYAMSLKIIEKIEKDPLGWLEVYEKS